MGWNHRVLATEYKGLEKTEVYLQIHEVYYDENGIPNSYTLNPVTLGSEEIKGLKWTLNKMKECLKKPILWGDERFPNEYKP